MLKAKKILESVLPASSTVPEANRNMVLSSINDGAMICDSQRNSIVFCLRCNTETEVQNTGAIVCRKCGNTRVRQKSSNDRHRRFRVVERVEDCIVIKDIEMTANETMKGISLRIADTDAIVLQGTDFGYFEYRRVEKYNDAAGRKWSRVKKPPNYRYTRGDLVCNVLDETVYEDPLYKVISSNVFGGTMLDMFTKLRKLAQSVESDLIQCPEFDESRIRYDFTDALVVGTIVSKEESADRFSQVVRTHTWCSACGKYASVVSGNNSYMSKSCPNCHSYLNTISAVEHRKNYVVTPQEFEDGTMLIRYDEVIYKAVIENPEVGVDPAVQYRPEITKVGYIYVTMDGKAHFFDQHRKPTDRTGIYEKTDRTKVQKYLCSAEQIELILNNKAVKRTGFVEHYNSRGDLDLKYFDALVRIPHLEMLSKMNMGDLVYDLIYKEDKDIPAYLRTPGKDPGIKSMSKPQIKSLTSSRCNLSMFIPYMQVLKKDPEAIYDDFLWLSDRSHHRHVLDILRVCIPGMTVAKIRDYIERVDDAQCCQPDESMQLWSDYLRMLRTLECDLTDKYLIYPNSLKREHDKASRKITQVRNEKINESFRQRAKENEKYEWENDRFKVLIPREITELYEEGRRLSHCVGSYGQYVADGSRIIAFIRRIDDVDTPLCTIEIRDNQIVQARGYSNRPADNIPYVRKFMNAWAKEKGLSLAA